MLTRRGFLFAAAVALLLAVLAGVYWFTPERISPNSERISELASAEDADHGLGFDGEKKVTITGTSPDKETVGAETPQLERLGQSVPDGGRSGGGGNGLGGQVDHDSHVESQTEQLAGQVLFTNGRPASGVVVEATALQLFPDKETGAAPISNTAGRAVADAAGQFAIAGLADGEYELRAIGPSAKPVIAVSVVRAGSRAVRLVLGQEVEVWIDGYVSSQEGGPLDQVAVHAGDGEGPADVSGADGSFGFYHRVLTDRPSTLTLVKEGFADARASIDADARDEQNVLPIDVTMQPVLASIRVAGEVRDEAGNGLAGRSLYLQSGNSKYRAVSDGAGAFVIEGIQRPGAYRMWVSAGDGYGGYTEPFLKVPMSGIRGLEIVLQRLGGGRVSGQMVDPRGRAVPNFTLTIGSESAPGETVAVTSDAQGNFLAEDVPQGRLRIQSSSFPRFVTSGVTLSPGGEIEVRPVLDVGDEQLAGRVIGDAGVPIAGADVTLSWVRKQGSMTHESLRKSVTDTRGDFVFFALGEVDYDLIVRAARHESAHVQGVGTSRSRDIEVQLTPLGD